MTELTQKLLELDSRTNKELSVSDKLAQEMVIVADNRAQKMMSEAKELFVKEKNEALKKLSLDLEARELESQEILKKNIQSFETNFTVDHFVEKLILIAKKKICP